MKTVTMHKAKSTLSQLVAAVEAGEEIIIMRGKVPAARLVGLSEAVLEILPVGPLPPFTKEDGEPIVDNGVRRSQA